MIILIPPKNKRPLRTWTGNTGIRAGVYIPKVEGGGPGSGCHGPNCGRKPGPGEDVEQQIKRSPFQLTPEQERVATTFRQQVARDPEGMKEKYRQQFGNVLNADNAKELSPDYQENRTDFAVSVHEPASWLVRSMFAEEMAKPAPPDKLDAVMFMAGGAGSGKTTALEGQSELAKASRSAQVIYDGTLSSFDKAAPLIRQAVENGKQAIVAFVYRDPVDSFVNGVVPRSEQTGRVVPLEMHAKQHEGVRDTIDRLRQAYKDNPNVSFHTIDNSRGWGKAALVPFEELPPDRGDVRKELRDGLDKAYREGKISEKIYRAIGQSGGGGTKKDVTPSAGGGIDADVDWESESAEEITAGGPGSGRHPYGSKMPPLYHGTSLDSAVKALTQGLNVGRSSELGYKVPSSFITEFRNHAFNYAMSKVREESAAKGIPQSQLADQHVAVVVLRPAIVKKATESDDERELRVAGGIPSKYVRHVEVYRYGDVEKNPNTAVPLKTIQAGGPGSGRHPEHGVTVIPKSPYAFDVHSTPTKQYYSWMEHPVYGLVVTPGAANHVVIGEELGIPEQDEKGREYEGAKRGTFVVDKNKEHSALISYKYMGLPSTGTGDRLRQALKVPQWYRHINGSSSWKVRGMVKAGGPGSGCRGPNCGRPSTDSAKVVTVGNRIILVPTTEKKVQDVYHLDKSDPVRQRSDQVVATGRETIKKYAVDNPEFGKMLSKLDTLNAQYERVDKSFASISQDLVRFWEKDKTYRETPEGQKEFNQLDNKMHDNLTKSSAISAKQQELSLQITDHINAWLDKGGAAGPFEPIHVSIKHSNAAEIDAAVRDFDKLTGGQPGGQQQRVEIKEISWDKEQRSFFNAAQNTIYLTPNATRATVFHELGHWFEWNTPHGTENAFAHLESRTHNDTASPLRNLSVGMNYKPDEVAKPDSFPEPYTGKIYSGDYQGKTATEVTSMGMQHLAENAGYFYRRDPEHFYFTIGMIANARAERENYAKWMSKLGGK